MPTRHERNKQLEQERQRQQQRRKMMIGAGIVLGLVVLGGVAAAFVARPAPSPTPVAQVVQGQCGPVQTFASQGGDHIAPNQEHPPYNSNPPTSGWHWANPQDWNAYTTPQVQEQLVHNLEHGGIVIQYNNLSEAEVARLTALYRSDRYHLILAPYPGLPAEYNVALTAWTHLQLCNGVNENSIKAFINTYRDKGPELVP